MAFQRDIVSVLAERVAEPNMMLMQVVVGPRQTGKSTAIAQMLETCSFPSHSVSADDVLTPNEEWLSTEWQQARNMVQKHGDAVVLVVDEIQKVPQWANVVKGLWDADRRNGLALKVVLSGTSALLVRKGLEDSLAGRFELLHSTHWSWKECEEAFGYSFDDYLFFGGYPGAAPFVADEKRWRSYMREAIIEPTISKDVLEGEVVRKPALLRALFELGAQFSAQELSYNKILGQLTEAGNTTTLAHYLDLLDKAGMLRGLQKYSDKALMSRKSSPRFLAYDTSLMVASTGYTKEVFRGDSARWGHVVESAVGAYLLAQSKKEGFSVHWWRQGVYEVDFVLSDSQNLAAIEVKSGRTKSQGGMAKFLEKYPHARRIVVGGAAAGAVDLQSFLAGEVPLF